MSGRAGLGSQTAPQIRFVCNTLTVGGAERHWAALLPSLRRRGTDARLATLRAAGPLAAGVRSEGVPVDEGSSGSNYDPRTLLRAARLRRERPAVVVSLGTIPGVVGTLVATGRSTRHVVSHHEGPGIVLQPRERRLQRWVLRRCDQVIAVSPSQVPALVATGVPADRVVVVPNGIDAEALRRPELRTPTRASLGVGPGAVLVLMLGALRVEKRADLFLDAVAEACAETPQIVGRIAGPGSFRGVVPACCELLGPRDDVAALLAAADVLLLPSDVEALPLAVLEAMAAGLAVVATDVGDVSTAVHDEVTGLLVRPGDASAMASALVRLARSPDLRHRLALAGQAHVRSSFGWDVMVDGYARALRPAV